MTPQPATLLEGLTVRRFLAVTALCAAAALAVVRVFYNTYWDLLVSALCVGYTSMLLFTVAGNLSQRTLPREVAQAPKKAIQYGTGAQKTLERLARSQGCAPAGRLESLYRDVFR